MAAKAKHGAKLLLSRRGKGALPSRFIAAAREPLYGSFVIQIRRVTLADAPAIWKAEVETARVPGRLISRPAELVLSKFESRIRELEPTGCYVVASDDDGVCGHAVLDPMELEALNHVFRLTVVVHPSVQKGV